jgi:N-acyl-D-amino-acid deacylase
MPFCDTLIQNALVFDGSGVPPTAGNVALERGRIVAVGQCIDYRAEETLDAGGLALAPGFIDVHTHDDLFVIENPEILPKLSQGVTTVIVGNCGISGAPVDLKKAGRLPEPLNLLGVEDQFAYPTFQSYVKAVNAARPSINVAGLVGHTALRNNHMDRLDRSATAVEVEAMKRDLRESLDHGALGLSTGLAYASAFEASPEEVVNLAEPLSDAGGIYTTHMRTEAAAILEAMNEAFNIGAKNNIPIVISHLKCSGPDNWGRSSEVLSHFMALSEGQSSGCDCYPYAATSTVLDARQVDERMDIVVTWSIPFPEMAGKTVRQVAEGWGVDQFEAAERLRPAGAIYFSLSEDDMRQILTHPATMIGSDGLPNDPRPHARLWGTFPRVLGHFARDLKLFSLSEGVRKMTSLPAERFGLKDRGWIKEGFAADMVLFDPEKIIDTATFEDPIQPAAGIQNVYVNGGLAYTDGKANSSRTGGFLTRA